MERLTAGPNDTRPPHQTRGHACAHTPHPAHLDAPLYTHTRVHLTFSTLSQTYMQHPPLRSHTHTHIHTALYTTLHVSQALHTYTPPTTHMPVHTQCPYHQTHTHTAPPTRHRHTYNTYADTQRPLPPQMHTASTYTHNSQLLTCTDTSLHRIHTHTHTHTHALDHCIHIHPRHLPPHPPLSVPLPSATCLPALSTSPPGEVGGLVSSDTLRLLSGKGGLL